MKYVRAHLPGYVTLEFFRIEEMLHVSKFLSDNATVLGKCDYVEREKHYISAFARTS